ncbi:hypothetical protein JTB14_026011, partial [Gonioctena quinquepunctata]
TTFKRKSQKGVGLQQAIEDVRNSKKTIRGASMTYDVRRTTLTLLEKPEERGNRGGGMLNLTLPNKKNWRKNLEGFPNQIYNCDEISLFHDPSKTKIVGANGVSNERKTAGREYEKTILMCCSPGGKSLPLLCVFKGKYVMENWISESDMSQTPISASERGWMETKLFYNRFKKGAEEKKRQAISKKREIISKSSNEDEECFSTGECIDSLDLTDQEEESNEDLHNDDYAVVKVFGKTPKSFKLYLVRIYQKYNESYKVRFFKRHPHTMKFSESSEESL